MGAVADSSVADAPPLDLDEALRELDAAYDVLPEAALRACQANRELAIPRLIAVLERAVRCGQDGAVPVGNATIYALFLLAEFKATEAIPVIWQFLKLPYDIPEEHLGDSITEDLSRLIAIFAGPRLELLDEIATDQTLNEWVRSAAIHACPYLLHAGLLSRPQAIAWLQTQLSEATRRRDTEITDALVCALLDLNANEARAEIERAFQEELVDEWMVNLDSVNKELRPDAPDESNRPPHHPLMEITDTVEEIRGWNWQIETSDEIVSEEFDNDAWPPGRIFSSASIFKDEADDYLLTTIRHEAPRAGRNDPCPCGSGKKYKKCCLRNTTN